MRTAVLVCLGIINLQLLASGQALERGPSTPEERQRVISIAHKMEQKPLDKGLRKDQEWALDWIEEVPDVHVDLCKAVLGDFTDSSYKYRSLLAVQLTLSSAAFIVENPQQADDQVGEFMAGVESVLRAYQAILKQSPKDKSAELDTLLEKQSHGQLKDFVRKAADDCSSDSDPSNDKLQGL